MKTIRKKIFIAAAMICLGLTSCNDWLDVKMEDQVMENTLFKNYAGYMSALNGVYMSMNNLYGSTLNVAGLDIMAQYYCVTNDNKHKLDLFSGYEFSDIDFETYNTAVWNKAYEILANLNVIIERTDSENPLTESQRAILRGEALALRGFIHFDLLRLYGPIYSENPTASSIPYQNSSSRKVQPLLPANEVLDLVIADLKAAEALLRDYDPIITEGVKNEEIDDNGLSNYDLQYRQIRMNYYAVEALLARAYLWQGDKSSAYDIAKNQIIDKITTNDLEVFPWTKRDQVTKEDKPDYLFSSEVMFSLYNSRRYKDIQSVYFAPTLMAKTNRLTFYGAAKTGDSKIAYFYDDDNDIRATMWDVVEPTEDEKKAAADSYWGDPAPNTLALKKYSDFTGAAISDADLYRYMMPLIRLSEVYLIAAETAPTETEGRKYINTIRNVRDCHSLADTDDFNKALTFEMAREVIGEGQLFYFYKRRGAEQLIGGGYTKDWMDKTTYKPTADMVKSNYILPIPKAETDKRVTIGNN